MFFIGGLIILALILLLIKYREQMTFSFGRLSRRTSSLSNIPLTRMGPDQFIQLSFGRVHYIYRSSSNHQSKILNIFIHGFSTSMEIWEDVVESLIDENYSCLIFDLYGRGWSDSPDVLMNIDLFVNQLVELLFALDLPFDHYNLFGVSMGGAIAQRFAELYPQKVSGLILCCSAGLNPVISSKFVMFLISTPILGPVLFKLTMRNSDSKTVRQQWTQPDGEKYRQYQQYFHQICREHPGYLRSLYSTILNFDFQSIHQTSERIRQLNIPILIIWGDKDAVIPVDNAFRYHQMYKDSLLCIVPGANHSLLIEHSSEAIAEIKKFLSEKFN